MSEEITIKKDDLDKLINEKVAELINQKPKETPKIAEVDLAEKQLELSKKQKEDSQKEFERASLISKFESLKKEHKNDETSFIFQTIEEMKGKDEFYDKILGLESSLLKIRMEKEEGVIKELYNLGKIKSFEDLAFEIQREKEKQEEIDKANNRANANSKIIDTSKMSPYELYAHNEKERIKKRVLEKNYML